MEMNFWQMTAYVEAIEREESERLVLTMNALATAFHGNKKQRKDFIRTLLQDNLPESPDAFDQTLAMQHLATPITNPATAGEQASIKEWAAAEFAADPAAFQPRK